MVVNFQKPYDNVTEDITLQRSTLTDQPIKNIPSSVKISLQFSTSFIEIDERVLTTILLMKVSNFSS